MIYCQELVLVLTHTEYIPTYHKYAFPSYTRELKSVKGLLLRTVSLDIQGDTKCFQNFVIFFCLNGER